MWTKWGLVPCTAMSNYIYIEEAIIYVITTFIKRKLVPHLTKNFDLIIFVDAKII